MRQRLALPARLFRCLGKFKESGRPLRSAIPSNTAPGKRRRLRFRDGIFLRANSEFGNAFATTAFVTGALCGKIIIISPATATLDLPSDVAEEVFESGRTEVETLWRLGDPPLNRG